MVPTDRNDVSSGVEQQFQPIETTKPTTAIFPQQVHLDLYTKTPEPFIELGYFIYVLYL